MPRCPDCGLVLPDSPSVKEHIKRHKAAQKARITKATKKKYLNTPPVWPT